MQPGSARFAKSAAGWNAPLVRLLLERGSTYRALAAALSAAASHTHVEAARACLEVSFTQRGRGDADTGIREGALTYALRDACVPRCSSTGGATGGGSARNNEGACAIVDMILATGVRVSGLTAADAVVCAAFWIPELLRRLPCAARAGGTLSDVLVQPGVISRILCAARLPDGTYPPWLAAKASGVTRPEAHDYRAHRSSQAQRARGEVLRLLLPHASLITRCTPAARRWRPTLTPGRWSRGGRAYAFCSYCTRQPPASNRQRRTAAAASSGWHRGGRRVGRGARFP